MNTIKTGIFFGGPSREREISFAGGRTVYDNLNKAIFEPVPIFVDSFRNFILLDWQFIYKGTIRDFYPPVEVLPPSPRNFQVYVESLGAISDEQWKELIGKVGRKIELKELPALIDIAFLALHGSFGEDGQIQGLLESLQIPYTGSGIRACSIGMDKAFQKKVIEVGGFASPEVLVISRKEWMGGEAKNYFAKAKEKTGLPMVVRPANQGSSIGVSILDEKTGPDDFNEAVSKAFFIQEITPEKWHSLRQPEKIAFLRELTDIRDGLGFPLIVNDFTFYHPEELYDYFEKHFSTNEDPLMLESYLSEQRVVVESFLEGKEFSCIVIRGEEGHAIALPPTEIVKGKEVFDYRSKYLPGLSRKVTPIELPEKDILAIRKECERLFDYLEFNTYARIDGFINREGVIFLNDPNTTSGMMPSSFFFHQAAEIGLNPSQFLTYIIRTSIWERINSEVDYCPQHVALLKRLDMAAKDLRSGISERKKIAVIMGGYSFERHISVESGRNIFEKLSSSEKYEPVPVFLMGTTEGHDLYQLPINLLLKDNADDIRDKILHFQKHPLLDGIREQCRKLTERYASGNVVFEPEKLNYNELAERVDGVFIALHGRPGEDGEVQARLERVGLPYNGSGTASSQITINKYETLKLLREHGFSTAHQKLVYKQNWEADFEKVLKDVESEFGFPLIAKPVDDGCSSAVKVIRKREELKAYLGLMFRNNSEDILTEEREVLRLKRNEEFPAKQEALIETLITRKGARHFLEITGGMLTHSRTDGSVFYEVFEPSEALAGNEILSLEEKFLAGEGQNITPARFARSREEYVYIAGQVKEDLEKAARILNVTGYCRIDAFVRVYEDNRAETIIIEINSLPGMTPATCIYHQAALNGYKPYDFIDKILTFGFQRSGAEREKTV